jgi:hypothetical protein
MTNTGRNPRSLSVMLKNIINLEFKPEKGPRKIAEFSEKLSYCVQALETVNKLNLVNGNVSMTLEKLSGIRSASVVKEKSCYSA